MSVTTDDLLYAIETSLFQMPELPGKVCNWSLPGLRGRWSPALSLNDTNFVGVVHLQPNVVMSTIRAVHDFYTERKRNYAWIVGDMSEPKNIGEILRDADFFRVVDQSGMVLTDMELRIETPPNITVRVATEADVAAVQRLYIEAYPVPAEYAPIQLELMRAAGGREYLAYIAGREEPIAVASTFYLPQKRIAVLQGGATLAAYRHLGAYRSLNARRVADARAAGMEAAVVQADKTTSAPIFQKLGFQELCSMYIYTMLPHVWG